ncbi:MAG: bifunctional acetate--CoA ligase family protein/GNAT family N-acetyltransferase [Alphaproteobacteria bacterium]|nr:bifunctional acetate--CoA ligase family protein/GNAT family N-acetyltransferase [Alphaproteobacteria bacterium]
MSIRNLDALLRPQSVALIGASQRPGAVGTVVARNLVAAGFKGQLLLVNPRHKTIAGLPVYPDVADLPLAPDLAVIATPPATVPGLVAALAARGTRAAVVITAGVGAKDGLRQAMLDAARPHLLRVLGPNCVGVLAPQIGLNASFAHIAATSGDLAFVTQSGAILVSVLDWAASRGIGFSHMVSLGDMADVDFGDMLDHLGRDANVRAILLYIEQVTHARKFMSAARATARIKPVVVVKAGRGEAGAKAAASHTGALAGMDAVYDAAFRRAGMLRVRELADLFDAVETLAMLRAPAGDRLVIVTNGGGLGVMAVDALAEAGGRLAALRPDTMERLNAVLPPTWSHDNPVDIIGDADGSRYAAAVSAVLEDRNADALLVLNCPTAITSPLEAAEAVIKAVDDRRRSVLTSWVGGAAAEPGRRRLAEARIASFDTPDQAGRGFMQLVEYRRNQEALMQTPPTLASEIRCDTARGRAIVDQSLASGQEWLGEAEAKDLLTAYGVPVVPTRIAANPEQVAELAHGMMGPVAVKIRSPDITHKTDVGGVALDLATPIAARQAAARMLDAVRARRPEARLEGFTVQPMASRPRAHELIVGIVEDRQFGPVVLIGQGGTAVELADDKALALPPLNLVLARAALARTRVWRLLQPHRGRPGADVDAIALAMIRAAQIAIDLPEVVELDINPLLADADGVLALDARVRVRPLQPVGGRRPTTERLAIRPYPQELEEIVADHDGRRYRLRPIRPEDEPALRHAFTRLSPHAVRMRFFAPLRTLEHAMAARLTQIDYDREMAFVLAAPLEGGVEELYGVGRLSADPDNVRAEFAVIVRTDVAGKGLGRLLMEHILSYARARGIGEVHGDVLAENTNMLELCRQLGFSIQASPDDGAVMQVSVRP